MIERLVLVIVLLAAVALLPVLLRRLQQQRLRRTADRPLPADLVTPGRPTVVAFSLPDCRDCRTRQAPVLTRLSEALGIPVRTLQVTEHPDLVERLGILTVPSTLVLGADGRLRALNHGFADLATLQRQLGSAD